MAFCTFCFVKCFAIKILLHHRWGLKKKFQSHFMQATLNNDHIRITAMLHTKKKPTVNVVICVLVKTFTLSTFKWLLNPLLSEGT